MTDSHSGAKAIATVLGQLDVAAREPNVFTSEAIESGRARLFGGARRGTGERRCHTHSAGLALHSLHAYFYKPAETLVAYRAHGAVAECVTRSCQLMAAWFGARKQVVRT